MVAGGYESENEVAWSKGVQGYHRLSHNGFYLIYNMHAIVSTDVENAQIYQKFGKWLGNVRVIENSRCFRN